MSCSTTTMMTSLSQDPNKKRYLLFNQQSSSNCWLAAILMMTAFHESDLSFVLQYGQYLLSIVGFDGLPIMSDDPWPEIRIITKTPTKRINFKKEYYEFYKDHDIPDFRCYEITIEFLEYLLNKLGPIVFSIDDGDDDGYHSLLLIKILPSNVGDQQILYLDSAENNMLTFSISEFNKLLLRDLDTDPRHPLKEMVAELVDSSLLYYEKPAKDSLFRLLMKRQYQDRNRDVVRAPTVRLIEPYTTSRKKKGAIVERTSAENQSGTTIIQQVQLLQN